MTDATTKAPALPKDLGQMRTIMAADRTLMAWIRTGFSMISFGITIYKVLEGIQQKGLAAHPNAPRTAGLLLVGLGAVSIAMGTWEYRQTLKDLAQLDAFSLNRPALIMAVIIAVTGLVLFIALAAKVV
jgi:putative membrane protein